MSDIFVSYARQDRERVRGLASQLEEQGWTIWWDRQIFAGADFDVVIQREVEAARCVLVVWSAHSIGSRWVKAEAGEGLRLEKLIPILIDASYPPLAFRNIQTVSFVEGGLDAGSPAFPELFASLTHLLGPPPYQAEPAPLPVPPPEPVVASSPIQPPEAESADTPPADLVQADVLAPEPIRMPGSGYLAPGAAILFVILLGTAFWALSAPPTDSETIATTGHPPPVPPPSGVSAEVPASADEPVAAAPPVPMKASAAPAPQPVAADATVELSAPEANAITQAAAETFIAEFVAAANAGNVDLMLPFYADRVDYFGRGSVGREVIRDDKQTYYRRWPRVKLTLAGDPAVVEGQTAGTSLVTFTSTYEVESPAREARASGTVQTTFVVAVIDGALKVIDHKETTRPDAGEKAGEGPKKRGFWGKVFGSPDRKGRGY